MEREREGWSGSGSVGVPFKDKGWLAACFSCQTERERERERFKF